MLYTVLIKKKLIIEADSEDEARCLVARGEEDLYTVASEEVIDNTRKTSKSEKIWFALEDK